MERSTAMLSLLLLELKQSDELRCVDLLLELFMSSNYRDHSYIA